MDTDPGYFLVLLTIQWGFLGGILLLIFLLACSALISGSEIAFFSLTSNQLKEINEADEPSGPRIFHLKEKPRRLLATILITGNVVNIGIVILSYYLFQIIAPAGTFYEWGVTFESLFPVGWLPADQWASFINFMISVVGITFMLVLFGEVVPKIYANLNNIAFAKVMSAPITILMVITAPLNKLMVRWGNIMERRLGSESAISANKVDIDRAIDLAVSNHKDSKVEAGILKSIVSFNDVAVKQIMRSRMDIIALDTVMSLEDVLVVVKDAGFSRLPVYDEQLDNIKGILYIKDLIGYIDLTPPQYPWPELVRNEVLYVPEARKINELLKDFQREHLHMAIVVDEYGGTSGIVTMEDVIEEVIGEIRDEFDEEQEFEYRRLSDSEFIFEGKTMLIDVCRIINVDKSSFDKVNGDADSLAGLLLDINGRMPVTGQKIALPPFSFTVLSLTPKRIERIKVQIDK